MLASFFSKLFGTTHTVTTDLGFHLPVSGKRTVTASLTRPANTTAYDAKDAVSSSTSAPAAITIANASRDNGIGGFLVNIRAYTSQAACTARLRVHLYSASPTLVNDNSPFTCLLTNYANRIGHIDLPAFKTSGTGSTMAYAQIPDIRFPFNCASGSTSIYAVLETLDAFTPDSAQAFHFAFTFDQD